MTALPRSAFNSEISEQLARPLRDVARRRWRFNATVAICQTLIAGLFVLLTTVLILGHFQNLWMPARVLLALATWVLLIASAIRFLRPIFGRWNLGHSALLVEHDRPDLHERLSSAISIARQSDDTFNGSPGLIAHLFSQAEADAAEVQPEKIVPADRAWHWALLLSPVLIAWVGLTCSAASRHVTAAGLYGVLMPWKTPLSAVLPPGEMHRRSPQITSIEIRCDYPAYTGLAPTMTNAPEGTIQALVGTRVTLTVHTALPVDVTRSQISIDPGMSSQLTVPMTQPDSGSAMYEAQFTITHTGGYQINLTNEFSLTNQDGQTRGIVAVADDAPSIVIISPESQVKVGTNDIVPVKYIAKDDFGVAKIELLIQVGEGPTQTVPVNFTPTEKRMVMKSPLMISMADLLKTQAGKTTKTETIAYQLRVTDNRDPEPQIGLSNRQFLKVDLNDYQEFQAHEEKAAADELRNVIRASIDQSNQAERHIQPTRDAGANQPLETWRKRELDEAAAKLPQTDKELLTAASANKDGVLQNIARQVRQIAENPLQSAADNTAEADLNADKGRDRMEAVNRGLTEIADARRQLQKILDDGEIDKAVRQAEAARDLADAAQKQQNAADMMKTPEQVQNDPQKHQAAQEQRQAMRDQEQADQKLQQALQQSDALRDPQAQSTAQKLEQLIHKVDEVAKHQDAAEQQTEKQKTAADIQQAANAIAQQQESLNQDIQKSTDENKQAMAQANANPPAVDQQKNIVNALDRNQLQDAHNQMNQQASQLHNEARQLQNLAKSNDLRATQQQQDALKNDQQSANQAQQDRDAARQAANDLNKVVDNQDAAIANAKKAAEKVEQRVDELHSQNDQAAKDAQAAEQHAKNAAADAEQAAHAATPDEAKKDRAAAADELNQAGKALATATKEDADADKAKMVAQQQKNAQAAADAAEQQAKQQDALAKAVASQQNALAEVQNPPPADQAAQQQNQLVDQTKDAKKDAEQLEQQAKQANNPNVEARATHAEADLAAAQDHAHTAAQAQQEAARQQQEAADAHDAQKAAAAEQKADQALKTAADQQQQAAQAMAKAEGELRGAGENAQAQQTPAQAAQEAAQAQQLANQQNPAAAQQAAKALKQAAQAMAKATPGMQQGQPQPGQDQQNQQAKMPSPVAARSQDAKDGISFANLPFTLPASVLDMGITADQWAVLPPLVKKDLLNAAQQNGPPEYRQMMREYFSKVAKMQESIK